MRISEQQGRTRRKTAPARRRRRTYSYSATGTAVKLRSGVRRITGSHMLALLMLLAMVALLAWFFVDTRFFIYEAEVQGNALVSADEVYRASGLDTMSVFYVNWRQVAERICHLVPGVAQVRINCQLPNRVLIHVREHEVHFAWRTNGGAFLVDGEGRVLKSDDGGYGELLSIHDLDEYPLQPGDQVDQIALKAVSRLHSLLPEVKAFDYSRAKGISLLDGHGWRIYFGDDQALPEKVATMHAVLQKIANSGASVKLIDLRFVGCPYYE